MSTGGPDPGPAGPAEHWLQASIEAGADAAEAAEALFTGLGALVTWTEGAGRDEILEPAPGATPLWERVRVTALLPADGDQALVRATLEALLPGSLPSLEFRLVADRDWDADWRRQLRPLRFGRRLWVCPVGQACPDPAGVPIILEPGLAFGTGTHPTTAMCLAWLDAHDPAGCSVLDFGCGSGILAIAALALGATRASGVDLDPQALVASGDNAERNGCGDRLTLHEPAASPDGAFDIVLANILSGPLVALAPVLRRRARPGTRVVLSGILAEQAAGVRAAYRDWVDLALAGEREGWVLLAGQVA